MGRTPCCDKNELKKGPWTPEEDQKLIDYIKKHGYGNWRTLPKNAGLQRCGKSCRLRWTNYLRPDIKRGRFSLEEEETIIQLHRILGNKWSAIASRLPGRTDNEIKNYWNTHIRKRLLRMGIDPITHNPRLDLLDISSILNSSLYDSPQMNMSRLLGVQPSMVDPELLRIATSLMSSQQQQQHENQDPNYVIHNVQGNPICNSQLPNQYHDYNQQALAGHSQIQSSIQEFPNCTSTTSFSSESLPLMQPNEVQFPSSYNIPELASTQTSQLTDWQGYNNVNFGNSAQIMMNPSSENFYLTNNSVLSSPTTMNSNSTYITSSTEDERESYSSHNILKYEVPDLLDMTSCNDMQPIGNCSFSGPWIHC